MPGRLQTERQADRPGARRSCCDDLPGSTTSAGDPADGELLLIGRRHKQDNNSWIHNSERLTGAGRATSC